jgi:hypothetical protein
MPVNPQVSNPPKPITFLDIATDAMIEVGLLQPGDPLDAEVTQWVFRKANYLLDEWSAQEIFVYSKSFQLFTLVPNLAVHTIGPGTSQTPATFPVGQRPVRIESAAIVLPSGGGVDIPIPVEDDDWWAETRLKGLASTLPTHLYYSADLLNGSLYFWPIPTVANQVRLELWSLLSQFVAVDDPIDGPGGNGVLPPAYRNALMLSLAETIQPGSQKEENSALTRNAARARSALIGNNSPAPRIETQDAGMPRSETRGRFNFLTGKPW